MTAQPLLLPVEQVIHDPPVEPLLAFVVVACWRGAHWKVWGYLWTDAERAHREAENLPAGWTHRRVLRVEVT